MAGKLGKSSKQILSVGFHLVVLCLMVITYDAGNMLVKKLRGEKQPEDKEKAEAADSKGFDFASGKPSPKTDPGLAKYVDKSAGGYVFRTDIPFPAHLKVISRESREVKIDKSAKKDTSATEYEQSGKVIRFTLREISGNGGADAAVKGKPMDFRMDGNIWKVIPSKDPVVLNRGTELEPDIPGLRLKNGLTPRLSWFGKERIKAGQKQELKDTALNLVFDDAGKGTVQLTFIGPESVHGHPCGAFGISGNIVKDGKADGKGRVVTESLKIKKGKILLSILYPVVLGSDVEGELTSEASEGGKVVSRTQGSMVMKTRREWKAIAAQPQEKVTPAPVKKPDIK